MLPRCAARTAAWVWVAAFLSTQLLQGQAGHARFVDPLLGADGGGNTFPGATLPFGMLKAGPDTGNNSANAGWTSTQAINGFSQTHVSGTGGGAKYGNILVQPTTGDVNVMEHASPRSSEKASPGFYSVTLSRYNVDVAIASGRRSAIYRMTFPEAKRANVLMDAGHLLSSYSNQHEGQTLTASSVQVISPTEFAGSTTINGGWNLQTTPYTLYFYAVTDTRAESFGTWDGQTMTAGSRTASSDHATGLWCTFATHTGQSVYLKIGISFMSIAQARENEESEIHGFDFAGTRAAGEAAWNEALAPVDLEGVTDDQKQQFYTALYHTMLMPADRTGENPLFQSNEPSYDDFYAIWDTFRSSNPLLTLIATKRETEIVRSLVDIYKHEGWLPDARSGNFSGRVQGGSNADMVIADAFLKHLPGVNWEMAYQAVRHDAEVTSPEPTKQGRGDLDDWKKIGYLTMEGTDRPASKHMEYAANDYAVALMAQGMGKQSDYLLYKQRAGNWQNLWDAQATDAGFNGFIWPRHRDGRWKDHFDPLQTGTWGSDNFYEGNPWTYSTYVPQDVAGLIQASGGSTSFVQRMDAFFDVPGRYDVGNEPGFLAPYLYLWAGRPDHTQRYLRTIVAKNYHSGPKGLPGNDDSGAMSSWYASAMLGFYPNAGQDVYLIGSPAYPRSTIRLANGRTFVIETEGNGPDKPYIVSATWDGKPWEHTWFSYAQLMAGGTLHLKMSDHPSQWGMADRPPSLSTSSRKP